MQKKGQAAMEFLMTYGWAILAAIVVIGILGVYFFRSDIMTPKGALVSAPFYANAWNAEGTSDVVEIEIKNNGGDTYDINSVNITSVSSPTTVLSCLGDTSVASIAAGGKETATITCDGIAEGDLLKGDIVIKYEKSGSDVELTSVGTITESVTA